MKKIESTQDFEETIKSGNIVIADFYADWCGPCQVQMAILEDLSKDLEGKARIIKINVDQQRELARWFSIRSIPTLVFFKNQNAIATFVGLQSKDELKRRISALEVQ